MAKTMEHLSDFAFVSMYNFTLARHDSYLAHMKSGIKQDTLAALRQAPMDSATPFPDNILKKAEDISKFEEREATLMLVLQAVRIQVTILTRGLTGHLMKPSLQNLPGKIWDDNIRKRVKCRLESFPHDRPRVSLLINDNYSVNVLFPSRLTRNKEQIPRKTLSPCTQTMNSQLNLRSLVAKDVVSAPGLWQRKDLSPGLTVLSSNKL